MPAVKPKSPAAAPWSVRLLTFRGALPLLVSVNDCATLALPIGWALKLRLVGLMLTAGTGVGVPEPARVAVCGLPPASSVIETTAARLPVAEGVKVRVTVWLALGARVTESLPAVKAKSPGLAPVRPMLLTCSGAAPVLVIVNDWAALVLWTTWLPKSIPVGVRLTPGTGGGAPAPLRETVVVTPGALLTTERVALRGPRAAGVKVTLIVWLPFGGIVPPPPDAANSPVGVTETPLMTSGAAPLFVSVRLWAPLVVPTVWPLKLRLGGLMLMAGAAGAMPLPLSATVIGLPAASLGMMRVVFRGPRAKGTNVIVTWQPSPGASGNCEQFWLPRKSRRPLPIWGSGEPTATVSFPVFVSVTV